MSTERNNNGPEKKGPWFRFLHHHCLEFSNASTMPALWFIDGSSPTESVSFSEFNYIQ
jgi:hypothetical protein